MAAFVEEVGVKLAHGRQVAVGVVLQVGLSILVLGAHPVVGDGPGIAVGHGRKVGHEDPIPLMGRFVFALLGDDGHGGGEGAQHTHGRHRSGLLSFFLSRVVQMNPEHLMRIVINAIRNLV